MGNSRNSLKVSLAFVARRLYQMPYGTFIKPHAARLGYELMEFFNRTLSSDLVSGSVKQKRIVICSKVIDATHLFGDWQILPLILFED